MPRRRIVTGHDAEGRSIIVRDGPTPGSFASRDWEEMLAFDGVPASLTDPTDPAEIETFRLTPAPGRIACRIFTIRPLGASDADVDGEWAARMDYTETEELSPPTTPWMHRTPTIDLIVIISGEMDLVLDGGDDVHLQPGDSVVQRGTMHAWRNTGAEPCVAVAFMVRAE